MDIQLLFKRVKKNVSSGLFTLRKIRKFVNDKCVLQIYKQTILPIIDYSGSFCCNLT